MVPILIVLLSRLAAAHFWCRGGKRNVNFDVRVKSVLVDQDSTTSEMCSVNVVREALVLKVLHRFLERNNVSFACNLLFNGFCHYNGKRNRKPHVHETISTHYRKSVRMRDQAAAEQRIL